MSAKKIYLILLAAICVLIIGFLASTFYVNKLLTTRGDSLTQLKAKNAALDREQVTLQKTVSEMQTFTDLKKITSSIVPEDKSQAQAVREIVNIASQNDIKLAAITFPASTLGNAPAGAAAQSAQAARTPAAPANSATSRLSQLTPVKNIPGVYQLPITVQSDPAEPVRYDKFVSFLGALERNRRTAQVSTITLEPSKDNRNFLSFTLTLNNYIKP